MKIEFLSWDWNEALRGAELIRAIAAFDGGPIYATLVDVGTDSHIVALSDRPLSPAEAAAAWISD